jgi:hypothetical protein
MQYFYRVLSVFSIVCVGVVMFASTAAAASFVVAAYNSLPSAQRRADIVCNGINDTAVLRYSLTLGQYRQVEFDDNAYTNAYCAQSVEWLAGDYNLDTTLYLPQVADTTLSAEGTVLWYNLTTGDAVVITGSLRTRFRFGTIWSSSDGAALAAKDRPYTSPFMPNIMSEISWQGLQHTPPYGVIGIGFQAQKHFVVNKISGTDVRGFAFGVLCDATGGGSEGTIDTNWWWLSYVRGCGVDIRVEGGPNGDGSVNSQQWHVNVDASLDGSVAIQTGANYDWWRILIGDVSRAPTTRTIVLDADAAGNVMEITPSLFMFDGYENNANQPNNVFIQVPENPAPQPGDYSHLVMQYAPVIDGPTSTRRSRPPQNESSRIDNKAARHEPKDDIRDARQSQLSTLNRRRKPVGRGAKGNSKNEATKGNVGQLERSTTHQKLVELRSMLDGGLITRQQYELTLGDVLRRFVQDS